MAENDVSFAGDDSWLYRRYDTVPIYIFKVGLSVSIDLRKESRLQNSQPFLNDSIYTPKWSSACGVELDVGEDYLLSGREQTTIV